MVMDSSITNAVSQVTSQIIVALASAISAVVVGWIGGWKHHRRVANQRIRSYPHNKRKVR